ncbi:undecaprenyl/decaprenyl-phosphate alpha-N-acetylglucosaminyl 1-phosphate transferase [bacterium]|nr:undecaprenyl/decaprenyl-phosphate alpha-N-acetylglucosaminyl 1-phosphate transferase [bacterium]
MNSALLAVLISFVVALLMTPQVRMLAMRLNVVAQPGGRRVHSRVTPLMGGIAMYAGFIIAVIIVVILSPRLRFDMQTIGILVGATYVAIIGVIDDKYELPGWFQALSILISGTILVLFGVKIQHVTNPFQGGHLMWLGWVGIPLTLIWVLMVTKAVDCMDGLDGLAAGISGIAAATLMLMALRSGERFEISAVMAAALLGGTIGFLRYNYPPAKIFMGTIGAQFLGFMLAGISIAGAFKIAAFVAVAAPVLVLGVPLFDTTFVVIRRIATGKKIHEADTSHLHHRLMNKGFSHRQVVWLIYGLTIVFCAAAYTLFFYAR